MCLQGLIELSTISNGSTPVRMVKPGLVEPQFPTVQAHTRRSIPEAASPSYLCEVAAEGTLSTVSDHQ
jgi:hypothetical protein